MLIPGAFTEVAFELIAVSEGESAVLSDTLSKCLELIFKILVGEDIIPELSIAVESVVPCRTFIRVFELVKDGSIDADTVFDDEFLADIIVLSGTYGDVLIGLVVELGGTDVNSPLVTEAEAVDVILKVVGISVEALVWVVEFIIELVANSEIVIPS